MPSVYTAERESITPRGIGISIGIGQDKGERGGLYHTPRPYLPTTTPTLHHRTDEAAIAAESAPYLAS